MDLTTYGLYAAASAGFPEDVLSRVFTPGCYPTELWFDLEIHTGKEDSREACTERDGIWHASAE